MMQLKSLTIGKDYYDPTGRKLTGAIEFVSEQGEIKVNLTQEHLSEILKLVANAMVATTKDIANRLTAETIEQAGMTLPALGPEPKDEFNDIPF